MQLSENPMTPGLRKKVKDSEELNFDPENARKNKNSAFFHQFEDLKVDLTRSFIPEETLIDLVALANNADVSQKIKMLFNGDKINSSENLAVEHQNQRSPERFNSKEWGYLENFVKNIRTNQNYKSIINIGVGGSDLGVSAVCDILKSYDDDPYLHFLSNLDSSIFGHVLSRCDPRTTLIVVSSKSFETVEALRNADLVRKWLKAGKVDYKKSMIAVTAYPEKAVAWGISPELVFNFPKTVGGRFSVWSAIGLPLALGLGVTKFKEFLAGGHAMDKHFQETELSKNIPVLLALLRIWNRNFRGFNSHVLLPYETTLKKFISWSQQLEMESNGKTVDRHGNPLKMAAAPLIWGDVGTNWQHSFGQFLMQGVDVCPIDFLYARNSMKDENEFGYELNHKINLSNLLGQANALALGNSDRMNSHKNCEGKRPSTIISWNENNPYAIGRLFALYEHITIVCGFIWDLNSFDQWGVQYGKTLAQEYINSKDLIL